MGNYSKAIAAILGGVITVLGAFNVPTDWATPELVSAVGAILTTVLVYVFPANKAG